MNLGRRIAARGILRDLFIVAAVFVVDIKPELFALGAAVFICGAALHFWSKGVLIRNSVVTTAGPYRAVRHPFYLGNFLIDLGICLISGNLYLTALYMPAFLLTYIPRIRREETFLIETHGERYTNYARTVPALLPYRFSEFFGPLDFSWDTAAREHEVSRLTRILAAPFYLLIAHAALRMSDDPSSQIALIASAATVAVGFNLSSIMVRRRQDESFWHEIAG